MATNGERFWIVDGEHSLPTLDADLSEAAERQRFDRDGGVRVTTGVLGTEVKWAAFSPCFASLFRVLRLLQSAPAPYILRYYLCGWFEETCTSYEEVHDRIEQIMSKSDMRIMYRAFVGKPELQNCEIPPLIQRSMSDHENISSISISCFYDDSAGKFKVSHIGEKSTIARFYGMEPVIYPYVNGGSYDEIVCEAYKEVLDSGKRRYDHVLANMRMPNNVVHWVPYHRLIIPKLDEKKRASVTVVTEISPVNIHIV